MSKRKTPEPKVRAPEMAPRKPSERPDDTTSHSSLASWFTPSAIRETVESVIIAFVLAFLFRTFEAEAFVIPTGSMAPTLMGRHKDLECPQCGYQYQVSASSRMDEHGVEREGLVKTGVCPMCRFAANLSPDNMLGRNYPTYNGDRILVGKFAYQFRDPQRWDVTVFKYPGDPTTNYIKRLVGLPGETVTIFGGDLWIQENDGAPLIARKEDPKKLLAMLQLVFDNDVMPKIAKWGLPARWLSETVGEGGQWTSLDGQSFELPANAREVWLRYHHKLPSPGLWKSILEDRRKQIQAPPEVDVPEQLISDFYAYNSEQPENGIHWVGDLALECILENQADSGVVTFDLVEGGRHFQCRVDLSDGKATLGISGPGAEDFRPTAATALKGRGKHQVVFANVDDQLRLLVDGREVRFDAPTTYDSRKLETHVPREDDLRPVAIAGENAALKVSHLKIHRDIYYIAKVATMVAGRPTHDSRDVTPELANPASWPFAFDNPARGVTLRLAPPNAAMPEKDQFLVMGDNSPQSKDSRLWDDRAAPDERQFWVNRELLVGQALFIYWPHSWHRLPGTPVPFPYFPNFGRMRLVR